MMSSTRELSGVAAAIVVAVTLSSRAADVTLTPAADTFVLSTEAVSNYGGAGQLAVSDVGRPQGEFQSLLRFDLSSAKSSFDAAFGAGQWKLQSATLRLSTATGNNPLFNASTAGPFAVSWMQNDSWLEGTGMPMSPTNNGVTYATLPTFLSPQDQPLGTFAFPGGTSGANSYSLNVSPGVTGDVESGGLLSVRLFAEPGATVAYNFSARSFQTAANRPALTLTATEVPEPSGLLAMSLAAGAGLLRRTRRHSR
jgi:hypothetical protein